jgi:hypothetical protein
VRFWWSRRAAAAPGEAAAADRELMEKGVDDGHVGYGDALGHGREDVPSSALAGGGAIGQ